MRTRSRTSFNVIPENCAAVVFSHLGDDPRDRIALAKVSRVWRDAERSGASLPVAPSALSELAHDVGRRDDWDSECSGWNNWEGKLYWMSKAADRGDVVAMCRLGHDYEERADKSNEETWGLCYRRVLRGFLTKAY
jgi:TPR repeat protein